MTEDELHARLFVARQQLRTLEEAAADALAVSLETAGEFSSSDYRSIASELERQAIEKREEIAGLESALANDFRPERLAARVRRCGACLVLTSQCARVAKRLGSAVSWEFGLCRYLT